MNGINVAVVDYGMGNTGSLLNMLKRIDVPACLTSDREHLLQCSHVILPGVGSFDKAVENLRERQLQHTLREAVIECGKPFLGICLGMQLLANSSEEGTLPGLGWIPAIVKKFDNQEIPVPHMSWNTVQAHPSFPLFDHSKDERYYFVHSYHFNCQSETDIAAITEYGIPFASAVHRNQIYGVQFHPEKSHRYGKSLLRRFLEIQSTS